MPSAGVLGGGSKLCIHNTDLPPYAREAWLDLLAEEIDLSGTITGPDSGFSRGLYLDLAERSHNVTGATGGGTASAAAAGCGAAVRACAAALGAPLSELKIVVQGLGGLGMPLAEDLARAGAALVVTDRNPQRLDDLLGALTPELRKRVDVVAPYQALEVEADILATCALGGVISSMNASELKVRAICGGANNQLVAESFADERDLARHLQEAGVLYVPDWMASAGGAIHGVMEFEAGEEFDPRAALARIHRVCGWQVDEVLGDSRRTGQAPLEVGRERYLSGLGPVAPIP